MNGPAKPAASVDVIARDNVFSTQPSQGVPGTIEAPANSTFTANLLNDGVLPHNIAFHVRKDGPLLSGDSLTTVILEGESTATTFTTPGPGSYYYVCTVHPQEMFGEFLVR